VKFKISRRHNTTFQATALRFAARLNPTGGPLVEIAAARKIAATSLQSEAV